MVSLQQQAVTINSVTMPQEAAIESRMDSVSLLPVPTSMTLADRVNVCAADPRVVLDLVSLDVCVGGDIFFRETFAGNGRTCGSCHPANNNLTIDQDFITNLPATDPLFVAEQIPALAELERSAFLRSFGLILENVDGFEDPTEKFVLRAVPHTLSMGTSITAQAVPTDGTTRPPHERTGWSGDGAPGDGELRDFTNGAIRQHFTQSLDRVEGTDFVLASALESEAVAEFMRTSGRTSELDLSLVSLTDVDADIGRTVFLSPAARCNGCHNNAGANVASEFNRNFDTGVEMLRLPDLNLQDIPFDGGFGGAGEPTFNFDANGDDVLDSFGNGTFNTMPLIEAADTGPFFHTDAFATIEDAIGFYNTNAFNLSPAGSAGSPIALTTQEIAQVGRFLRVINASFNVQMSVARTEAALTILAAFRNRFRDTQRAMLNLALEEARDALSVLSAVAALNPIAQGNLSVAESELTSAIAQASHVMREASALAALAALQSADVALGIGMDLTIGEGTLMF